MQHSFWLYIRERLERSARVSLSPEFPALVGDLWTRPSAAHVERRFRVCGLFLRRVQSTPSLGASKRRTGLTYFSYKGKTAVRQLGAL